MEAIQYYKERRVKFYFWVMICIILICLILVISIFIPQKKEGKTDEQITTPIKKEVSIEQKVLLCIEQEDLDEECINLFYSQDIESECFKLTQPAKDLCFSRISEVKNSYLPCKNIQNESFRNDCEFSIIEKIPHET